MGVGKGKQADCVRRRQVSKYAQNPRGLRLALHTLVLFCIEHACGPKPKEGFPIFFFPLILSADHCGLSIDCSSLPPPLLLRAVGYQPYPTSHGFSRQAVSVCQWQTIALPSSIVTYIDVLALHCARILMKKKKATRYVLEIGEIRGRNACKLRWRGRGGGSRSPTLYDGLHVWLFPLPSSHPPAFEPCAYLV